jgi:hypothetical protein
MDGFDAADFVAANERLGLRLCAVPLADGTHRLTRWRLPEAVANAGKIATLWAAKVGEDPGRLEQLTTHLIGRASRTQA